MMGIKWADSLYVFTYYVSIKNFYMTLIQKDDKAVE